MTTSLEGEGQTVRPSDIYRNAVDSLKIGMQFFLKDDEDNYSSRKHAILTLFHSIELFLKEYLFRQNPILIYKNIDAKITEDSLTVGIKDILMRLDNLHHSIPTEEKAIIEKIQARRNRIEHHRYDHKEEDGTVIAESLQFIMYFVEFWLEANLGTEIGPELLAKIQRIIFSYNEREALAEYRLKQWTKKHWSDWDEEQSDYPEEFRGTLDCPICGQCHLVIEQGEVFCFHCNSPIDAAECENCGVTYLVSEGCPWCGPEPTSSAYALASMQGVRSGDTPIVLRATVEQSASGSERDLQEPS
jgi:hypothetical protein